MHPPPRQNPNRSRVARKEGEATRPTGLEPVTCGSGNQGILVVTTDADDTCQSVEEHSASCSAFLAKNSPDLAVIIDAWADLPEAIRAGIVAMVKAAKA